MFATCFSTTPGVTRAAAIPALDRPSAISESTSRSRGVSDACGVPIQRRAYDQAQCQSCSELGVERGDSVKHARRWRWSSPAAKVLGFRTHGSPLAVFAPPGLILLFAFAICWISTLIGRRRQRPGDGAVLAPGAYLPAHLRPGVLAAARRLPRSADQLGAVSRTPAACLEAGTGSRA
jgi:hypothetical protein